SAWAEASVRVWDGGLIAAGCGAGKAQFAPKIAHFGRYFWNKGKAVQQLRSIQFAEIHLTPANYMLDPGSRDGVSRRAAQGTRASSAPHAACTSMTPGTALMAPQICGETLNFPGRRTSTSVAPSSRITIMLTSPSPLGSSLRAMPSS